MLSRSYDCVARLAFTWAQKLYAASQVVAVDIKFELELEIKVEIDNEMEMEMEIEIDGGGGSAKRATGRADCFKHLR